MKRVKTGISGKNDPTIVPLVTNMVAGATSKAEFDDCPIAVTALNALVTDGTAGTVQLVATNGTISETGTLIAGTLFGSATGTTSLIGATPTTNQVAVIGNFAAAGFTLNDGAPLSVTGVLNGGPFVTIVFENRDTIRFQIQEMARAERILTDEGIQTELDIYNPLIPEPGMLAATGQDGVVNVISTNTVPPFLTSSS